MSKTETLGKIAFINHEKKYVMIEYDQNGKKKTIRGSVDEKSQKEQKAKGLIKKTHHFVMGDVVSFTPRLTDRGEKMMASNIEFLYNNALDVLINKAKISNKFKGYLKAVDDRYFVKEMDSYLFFPVQISPWQLLPEENDLNEPVNFSFENLDKKDKIQASLSDNNYIPEFNKAIKLFKSKTPVTATVSKVSPHAIYLDVIADKIKAKLPLGKKETPSKKLSSLKAGDELPVLITYMGKSKIVVEPVEV